jgi:predicted  nucleic acid-binding Zn-ribbon protein
MLIDQDRARKSEYNFIRKNIEESPSHFKTIDYEGKRLELQERIQIAKERKSDMEAEKRKMNIIWIHKWALIKEKREEMERICNNIRMIKQRKNLYIKNILALHIIKKIFEVFDEKRSTVILEMKINFAVFQFSLGLKRYLRKKAPNRELRSKRMMR